MKELRFLPSERATVEQVLQSVGYVADPTLRDEPSDVISLTVRLVTTGNWPRSEFLISEKLKTYCYVEY